jgi:uncharacterized protein
MFEWCENHRGRPVKQQPLNEGELDRVSVLLARFGNKRSMNLEQLDGFFAALICGSDMIPPSEYLPVIWGDDMILEDTFNAQPALEEFLSLIMRHWNAIADTLRSGDVFLPLLLQDENGITHANDWARGFVRGMELRRTEWAALFADEDHGGWLVPIFALAHEHDPDPEMRPYKEPISADAREKLIVGAAAGVTGIYRHFETQRLVEKELHGKRNHLPPLNAKGWAQRSVSMRIREKIQAVLWEAHTALIFQRFLNEKDAFRGPT